MKLFDAHCHVPADDIDSMLERAAAAGVEGLAVCGTNSNDWEEVIELAEKFPTSGKCRRLRGRYSPCPVAFPMIGIHPWFCSEHWKDDFQALENRLRNFPLRQSSGPANIGIGECGLDFQDKFQNRAEQEECFIAHLELARELNRPVAIHCVQAWGKLLEILREFPKPKKILHAYGGSAELIPELEKLNVWFSFGEAVMNPKFKRAREAAAAAPAERLLIETDSEGEPEKLIAVARAVAELRGVPVEDVAEITLANAERVFPAG